MAPFHPSGHPPQGTQHACPSLAHIWIRVICSVHPCKGITDNFLGCFIHGTLLRKYRFGDFKSRVTGFWGKILRLVMEPLCLAANPLLALTYSSSLWSQSYFNCLEESYSIIIILLLIQKTANIYWAITTCYYLFQSFYFY